MCGLTGFWDSRGTQSRNALLNYAQQMSNQIAERGPDSYGVWCEENSGIAFGHRRLSIVDLSNAGHQPMVSSSGRLVIAYNGEIYNTLELQRALKEVNKNLQFKGNSDTEVILEACEVWGIETTCKRLNGMFAFSLWDKVQRKLYLARDRLGIKPLYWGYSQGVLFFGSQPKSFSAHPKWYPEIDLQALAIYFRFNYIPSPFSIFKGVLKLTPGTILSFDNKGNRQEFYFWSFEEVTLKGLTSRLHNEIQSEESLTDNLETLLKDAVKRQMVADVPLGAFLSGGIDSSTVVALMQAQSNQPIKTFSIGFHENTYDEAKYAAKIARHLGTDHHELYLDNTLAQKIIPNIPNWYDEPFADPSQIPTFLVSKLAKQHVKVCLSGDGGDELFAGYDRYFIGQNLWHRMNFLPKWLKQLAASSILKVSPMKWNKVFCLLPYITSPQLRGHNLHKLARILKSLSEEQFYQILVSKWEHPEELLLNVKEPLFYPWSPSKLAGREELIDKMQYIDILTYLPEDILAKVDRASMAVSLEARVPILDHRIVEFSWKLPLTMKYRQRQGKWLLRQVLYRYVPEEFFNRPKMGFNVPIEHWLRGPLREWAEHLLNENKLKSGGILNSEPIVKRWEEFLSGKQDWHYSLRPNSHYALWGILMFQAWRDHWKI